MTNANTKYLLSLAAGDIDEDDGLTAKDIMLQFARELGYDCIKKGMPDLFSLTNDHSCRVMAKLSDVLHTKVPADAIRKEEQSKPTIAMRPMRLAHDNIEIIFSGKNSGMWFDALQAVLVERQKPFTLGPQRKSITSSLGQSVRMSHAQFMMMFDPDYEVDDAE